MRFPQFIATCIVSLTTIGLSTEAAEPGFGSFFEGQHSFSKLEKRGLRATHHSSNTRRLSHVVVGVPSATCNPDYPTIAAALTGEGSRANLELCTGTFEEVVDIDPGVKVSIRGQGIGQTTVKPPSGLFIVNAGAGNVKLELEEITLDGDNLAAGVGTGDALAGVVCEFSCDAEIKKVEIKNIANTENGKSFDIFASTTTDETDGNKIEVEDSEFPNVSAVGIFVNGPGTSGKIKKNTLAARNPAINSLVIGMQVGRQATAKVKENSLTGFKVTGSSQVSTAINVFCSGHGTDIKKNTVDASDIAVNLLGSSLVDVEENSFSNGLVGVLLEYNPTLLIDVAECESIDVENNRLKRNVITNCENGVKLFSIATPTATILADSTVKQNHIVGSINGICLESGNGNSFNDNNIDQSTSNGVLVQGGEGNVFKNNNIDHSGENGFAVSSGDENIFKKNEIDNSGKSGILLFDDGTNPVALMSDFLKNEIEDSAEYGIKVEAGFNNVFKRNKLQDSGIAAIMGINGVIPPAAPANGNQYIANVIGADSSSASSSD